MAKKIRVPAISMIHEDWESCDVAMYVIVAASVDANRILADEERLILAARCNVEQAIRGDCFLMGLSDFG